ncbi:MAG TPA: DUF1491 family protein [Acidiphilium sp.]|nr:MAG: hypothetical protein B7Z67_08820 [Acidiphilium sp. 21-60-14]OYV89888.1 MAG: hypothetical protein B7Z57_10835 [Acidiphilium sp. 37-60-79]OZB39457.1 MAG: hypothetical protein B7X48_09135 [Acidiphilium sp. 34-60-192]HQT88206.1 DUF1491 family protein [Acidiphilium sp.]HQU23412.1 DUF1491 family protein [Acidiphilium sp.]
MEPRIKAGLWVQMALRLGTSDNKPGMVLHKGDADAGGVLVLLRSRVGISILSQTRDSEGRPAWLRTNPAPLDQASADAYVERQRRQDPDLWVIEFDAADGLPPFEGKIL